MTKHDPKAHDSSRQAGALTENLADAVKEDLGILMEFGDLSIEANRIRLTKAVILDSVLPGSDGYGDKLMVAVFKLPRGVMHQVVATMGECSKAASKRAAVILKDMEDRYLPERQPKKD